MPAKLTSPDLPNQYSESVPCGNGSLDHEALTALFRLVEITEPALLLCRDALTVGGDGIECIEAVNRALDRIGDVKRRSLGTPSLSNVYLLNISSPQ
jgi:hypothetical protein